MKNMKKKLSDVEIDYFLEKFYDLYRKELEHKGVPVPDICLDEDGEIMILTRLVRDR